MSSKLQTLLDYLVRVPSVQSNETSSRSIGYGLENDTWWVKFGIDVSHPLAWHVVQEFGHVLNSLSINEPLPTVFKPVSPPPYMNGGPDEYLSWVIECPADTTPSTIAQWLEGRLPRPVEDLEQWNSDDA